jgi:hypothetical protein
MKKIFALFGLAIDPTDDFILFIPDDVRWKKFRFINHRVMALNYHHPLCAAPEQCQFSTGAQAIIIAP